MPCSLIAALATFALTAATETPLVTGNGHGFAVYGNDGRGLTKLYAHPYSFTRADPNDALNEGIRTVNFIERLGWSEAGEARHDYLDDSHIIAVERAKSRQTFFMPWTLSRHVLIATYESRADGPSPRLVMDWAHPVAKQEKRRAGGTEVELYRFEHVDELLVVAPLAADAWAFLSVESIDDVERAVAEVQRWTRGLKAHDLVERELAELEAWRVKPAVTFHSDAERRLWRQSEVVLRMGQSREPNRVGRINNGLILAALPDGGWVTYWVRDMAYAIDALIRMGHRAEARAGLEAYFQARPVGSMHNQVGGVPYQISVVRYLGDGSEQPFFTQEGATNIELDDWGLVLWVLGSYVQRFEDASILDVPTYRGTIYESAKRYVAEPLLKNLDAHAGALIVRADTSIWEERQKDAKHFAFSTIAAIAGLRQLDSVAQRKSDHALHATLQQTLALLERGFAAAYVAGGRLHGTLEPGIKNDIDGAVLAAFNLGVVTEGSIMQATVREMEHLKVASGGYRRVTCILTDPKIFEYWYERQEFLFVDMSLAEVYLRLHQNDKADALLRTLVDKAARDHFIVPEMYVSVKNPLFKGDIGDPTGAIPMVGYGAGVYLSHLMARESIR